MIMEYSLEKIYAWSTIEKELCKHMEIDPKYFRDFHLTKPEYLSKDYYMDFWHVWMFLNYDDVSGIQEVWIGNVIDRFNYVSKCGDLNNKGPDDWWLPLKDAVIKMSEDIEERIYIDYDI